MSDDFFKDLKVIELASVLAGPSVGLFFAEQGAQVLKIENKKTGGDVTRSWKLPTENPESSVSAYFSSVNYKKRYLNLDLSDQNDYQCLIKELIQADVLITNFKKGDDKKFKLDYATLKQINPRLIYGEITGYGSDSDRVAYDLILQADSGFMFMNGTPDSGPVKMPVALIDLLAGHQLKEGILVALINRMKSNKGCKVSVSLFESALASLANQASNWLMEKHNPKPIGSKHPNIAPYGDIYRTADKKLVTLAIGNDKQFLLLCDSLNLSSLNFDVRFASNQNRVKNRIELEKLLQEKILCFSADELMHVLLEKKIPGAVIKTVEEVFNDPKASALINEEIIDGKETKRLKTVVYRITQ